MTVEPHSLEWAVALASGACKPPQPGDIARQVEDFGVVNLVKHWPFADFREQHCLPGQNEYIGVESRREGVL